METNVTVSVLLTGFEKYFPESQNRARTSEPEAKGKEDTGESEHAQLETGE